MDIVIKKLFSVQDGALCAGTVVIVYRDEKGQLQSVTKSGKIESEYKVATGTLVAFYPDNCHAEVVETNLPWQGYVFENPSPSQVVFSLEEFIDNLKRFDSEVIKGGITVNMTGNVWTVVSDITVGIKK